MKKILSSRGGFTLLFALIIITTVLTASVATFNILLKEMQLARFGGDSIRAVYAAESGAECALYWNNHGADFIAGNYNSAKCNGVSISSNPFTVNYGGYAGVARITVSKDASGNSIIQSDGSNVSGGSKVRVERGIEYKISGTPSTPPPTTLPVLSVSKNGTGSGTVSSSPSGINCGSDCSESYTSGTSVTLTATASGGSVFAGWSGCDSALGTSCSVTMNTSKTVGATFTQNAGPTLVYLSDLNWASASTDFGTVQKDKSIDGNSLRIAGVTYAKGIGTHAESSIVYNLNGAYTRFQAVVGVDDEVGNSGSVQFYVHVNGTWNGANQSSWLTGSGGAHIFDIDVTGVNTLELMVSDATDGIVDDHADWADAKLTRP